MKTKYHKAGTIVRENTKTYGRAISLTIEDAFVNLFMNELDCNDFDEELFRKSCE